MLTITTTSVYGRHDWYQAHATVKGVIYTVFEATRFAALSGVLRQLAAKGHIKTA